MPLAALPPFPIVTNRCVAFTLTCLVESATSLKTNSFSFKWQRSPPSPSQQPTQALASATTELDREAGRASYANIAWVGGSPEQTVQQCEGSHKPCPHKPVAKQPPQGGGRGRRGHEFNNCCLIWALTVWMRVSRRTSQQERESVWGCGVQSLCFCVCLWVCVLQSETEREREREREAVAVSVGGGETRQPVQQRFKVNGTSCAAPLPLFWIIPLAGTHPLDYPGASSSSCLWREHLCVVCVRECVDCVCVCQDKQT